MYMQEFQQKNKRIVSRQKKRLFSEINIFATRQNSKIMYSSEDLERFYFQYQTEGLPHGESLQSFCVKNKVPSKGEGTKLSAYELLSFYLNRL